MQIGKIKNITIKLNDFFLLLILAYGLLGILPQAILIFTLVIIHEFAHISMAILKGIEVTEIELYPFGGVARVNDFLEARGVVELQIALAGPISNFLLLFLGFFMHHYFFIPPELFRLYIYSNFFLGVFNLLPALPLDGGRIWRSLLANKLGFKKATFLLLALSRYISLSLLFFGVIGIWLKITDLNLIIIALFILISVNKDLEVVNLIYLRYLFKKKEELHSLGLIPIQEIGVTKQTRIKDILPCITSGKYHMITVIGNEGEILARFSEEKLLKALFEKGQLITVESLLLIKV